MVGMPIVGLATTEMVTAVENGVSGYLHTDAARLVEGMRELLEDPELARRMGSAARDYARERFSIERFSHDWDQALRLVAGGT